MGRPNYLKNVLLGASLLLLAPISIAFAAEDTPSTAPAVQSGTTPPENPPASSDNSAQAPAATGDDQIVCKKEPPPVGSRMGGKKVCRTVAEWRRIQAIAKETTDEIQSRKVPPSVN